MKAMSWGIVVKVKIVKKTTYNYAKNSNHFRRIY